jgi:hypothetical protein
MDVVHTAIGLARAEADDEDAMAEILIASSGRRGSMVLARQYLSRDAGVASSDAARAIELLDAALALDLWDQQ